MNKERDIWESVKNDNVYSVPEGYFDNLGSEVMSAIFLESGKRNAQQGTYTIPDHYFQDLPTAILAQLKANPGNISSPVETAEDHALIDNALLARVGNGHTYSVPQGYFEELPALLLTKASGKERPKVISLRSVTRRWMPYATAAALSGFMVLGAFIFSGDNAQQSSSQYYGNFNSIDVKKGVSDLSESEIAGYLNTHPAVYDLRNSTTRPVEADIQRSIKHISEEEITDYLQDNWEPGESPLKGI
ncbi:hypothetical protein ESB13_15525 [Filimonas effusa]|uniref:Uncharacterized protein n=2 Tax=Filimonas effusa TaxID=2508721 RepID=A0A4Q1D6Z9_9BACT|nr:hypothetical protein ESB13_15525 [Filimonas effusa]